MRNIVLIFILTGTLLTETVFCSDSTFNKFTGIESSYKLILLPDRENFGPWHEGSAGVHSLLLHVPVIFTAAYQYRLYPQSHVQDLQFMLDMWPALCRMLYANVSTSYSPSIKDGTIYPDSHILAELYFTGIRLTEISLGTKVSFYNSSTPVQIFASYHFITEKESAIARLFCVPYNSGVDASVALQYRHTFTSAGLSVGAGIGCGTSSESTERITLHDLWSYHCKLESSLQLRNGLKISFLPVLYYEEYTKDKYWKKFELELKVIKTWN